MNPTTETDFIDEKNPSLTDVEPVGHDLESEPLILTAEDDKRIQRRVDWNLMPILGVVVGWNFVSHHKLLLHIWDSS